MLFWLSSTGAPDAVVKLWGGIGSCDIFVPVLRVLTPTSRLFDSLEI
jgi:hypothetical protein